MAAKPTNAIDWAPADPADIVEPAGGDKTAGFDPGFKPPAQWFNWFWKLATDWFKYLRDGVIVGEAGLPGFDVTGGTGNTRGVKATGVGTGTGVVGIGGASDGHGVSGQSQGTGRGIFGDATGSGPGVYGQSVTGAGVTGAGGGSGSGVQGTGGTTSGAIGVLGIGAGSNGHGVKGTGKGTGSGVVAIGESGTAGNGVQATAGSAGGHGVHAAGSTAGYAVKASAGGAGIAIYAESGAGSDVIEVVRFAGWLKLSGANSGPNTGFANMLAPKNLMKAWGTIPYDNNYSQDTVYTDDLGSGAFEGFNIASWERKIIGSDQLIKVSFTTPMLDTHYAVTINDHATNTAEQALLNVFDKQTGYFRLYGRILPVGGAIAVKTFNTVDGGLIDFNVMGAQ